MERSRQAVINVCEAGDRWERGVGRGRVVAAAEAACVSALRLDTGLTGPPS